MTLTCKRWTRIGTLLLLGTSPSYCLGVDAQAPAKKANERFQLAIGQLDYPSSSMHQSLRDAKATSYGSLAFSSDGSFIAAVTGTVDEIVVTVWNMRTKKVQQRLSQPCSVHVMKFLKSKDWLLIACSDGKVRVWDYKKGTQLHTLTSPDKRAYGVRALDVAPDQASFVSGDRNLTLWDVATLKPTLVDLKIKDLVNEVPCGVAYAADGKTLAYMCGLGVRICDARTGRRLKEIQTRGSCLGQLAYHPDGKSLVMAEDRDGLESGCVRLWNLEESEEITAANAFRGLTHQVGYTPDGKYLIAAGGDLPMKGMAALRIWQLATGKQVQALVPMRCATLNFAVSPDGKWLALSGDNREVRLYEMKTLLAPPALGPGPPVPVPPAPKSAPKTNAR